MPKSQHFFTKPTNNSNPKLDLKAFRTVLKIENFKIVFKKHGVYEGTKQIHLQLIGLKNTGANHLKFETILEFTEHEGSHTIGLDVFFKKYDLLEADCEISYSCKLIHDEINALISDSGIFDLARKELKLRKKEAKRKKKLIKKLKKQIKKLKK